MLISELFPTIGIYLCKWPYSNHAFINNITSVSDNCAYYTLIYTDFPQKAYNKGSFILSPYTEPSTKAIRLPDDFTIDKYPELLV